MNRNVWTTNLFGMNKGVPNKLIEPYLQRFFVCFVLSSTFKRDCRCIVIQICCMYAIMFLFLDDLRIKAVEGDEICDLMALRLLQYYKYNYSSDSPGTAYLNDIGPYDLFRGGLLFM